MNINEYRLNAYNKVKGTEKNPAVPVQDENADVASVSKEIRRTSKPGTEPLVRMPVFEKINRKIDELSGNSQKESTNAEPPKYIPRPIEKNDDYKPKHSTRKNLAKGSTTLSAEDLKAREQAKLAAKSGTWFAKKNTTDEDVREAASKLTSGGLIMVPETDKKEGESESIYRRVAKFMVVIGIDEAAKILPHLTEEQTEKIIPEIAAIRHVSQEEAEQVLKEFESLLVKARESGGIDTARTMLTKAYGSEKAEQMLQKVVQYPEGKPFDYLEDANAERVGVLLDGESPAVQSIVLSQLDPKKAAQVINRMEPKNKTDVVMRLAKMKPVSPEVLEQINKSLRDKMMTQNTVNTQNLDGRNVLAQILKRMDPNTEYSIIGTLSDEDPELGADLRRRLFTEEDVIGADDRYLQNKLHDMKDEEIVLLLRGKNASFRDKIFANVSKRRALAIEDEEILKTHLLRSECEKVTSRFYADLRRAWETGELIVRGRDSDDEVYV